ncbi:uncharacterized protein [Parasteatoda tepidariorum]|uniref:uncharacterized protein n=1 Tax=Parasteatoda tepidariorum TaxID=114398 RepID=UPI001C71CD8C|nr:uncharacterized protein LOC107445184 [Parasteatoda tepidariorum]
MKGWIAARVVQNDCYMHDVVSGANDISSVLELKNRLINLLHRGGMDLHKWSSNEQSLLENLPYEDQEYHFDIKNNVKTLGVIWNPNADLFEFSISDSTNLTNCTKRTVLSCISRLFDPLGPLGPVIVKANIFMQKLWLQKLDWDQVLPDCKVKEWEKYASSLLCEKDIKINHCVANGTVASFEILSLCDASQDAYGAAIYLRCKNELNKVTINLLCSKSRIAPIKKLTIPRLELLAAELMSKFLQKLLKALQMDIQNFYLWLDSTITLAWIRTDPCLLKTFVSNRVSKIQEITRLFKWGHVPSESNPADLISRGVTADKISNSELWWHGAPFLKTEDYKQFEHSPSSSDEYMAELKKNSDLDFTVFEKNTFIIDFLNKSNSYMKLIRILSFIFRFVRNAKNSAKKSTGPISS